MTLRCEPAPGTLTFDCALGLVHARTGAAINDAKKRLADVATAMLHGEQEAAKAAAARPAETGESEESDGSSVAVETQEA